MVWIYRNISLLLGSRPLPLFRIIIRLDLDAIVLRKTRRVIGDGTKNPLRRKVSPIKRTAAKKTPNQRKISE